MGLSEKHLSLIDATAPVVAEHALEITQAFYPQMFKENPEVFAYFNSANQQKGSQPRALADAVVAYAKNIRKLEALGPAVNRIVQKHVALRVPPAGYDIVGKHLMWAIHQVLGDAVTQDIHDAWVAAYTQLAGILIAAESSEYKTHEEQVGGWAGNREFVVSKLEKTTSGLARITMVPKDEKVICTFKPGQFLTLSFKPADVAGQEKTAVLAPRHYSVISGDDKSFTICVRKVEGGVISTHIHQAIETGSTISLATPAGAFTLADLPEGKSVVFVGGGVGFTPLISMAEEATKKGSASLFIHSVSLLEDSSYTDGVAGDRVVHQTADKGRLTGKTIMDIIAKSSLKEAEGAHFYMCAPPDMLQALAEGLAKEGISADRVHYELFGPHVQL